MKPKCGIKSVRTVAWCCDHVVKPQDLLTHPLPPPDTGAFCLPRPSGTEQLSSSLTPHNTGKSMRTDNCLLITTIPFSLPSLDCFWLLFDLSLLDVTLVAFSRFSQPYRACGFRGGGRDEANNDGSRTGGDSGAISCY